MTKKEEVHESVAEVLDDIKKVMSGGSTGGTEQDDVMLLDEDALMSDDSSEDISINDVEGALNDINVVSDVGDKRKNRPHKDEGSDSREQSVVKDVKTKGLKSDKGTTAKDATVTKITVSNMRIDSRNVGSSVDNSQVVVPPVGSQQIATEEVCSSNLLSAVSENATINEIRNLEKLIDKKKGGSMTLEELIVSIIRPELSKWLDANLPKIVHDIVTKEVQRIVDKVSES